MEIYRPTRAEVRLAAVRANLLKLRRLAAPARLLFIVKANAYGHGAVPLARMAEAEDLCSAFGVASVEEGAALREAGIKKDILVLGSLYPFESFAAAIQADLTVTIASVSAAKLVKEAAARLGKKAVCHLKLESGMNRIGARRPGLIRIWEELSASGLVEVAGLYTHLSSADSDPGYTARQLAFFDETRAELAARGAKNLVCHAANSAAAVNCPESRYDLVRCGIAAYGLEGDFEPALSLKSRVIFLKDVREGVYVSYNKSYLTTRPTRIATIPVGYADGYLRALSGKAEVLIGGERCRVLGNVTMDMIMADVTDVKGADVGSEVVLLGRQGGREIPASELARHAGTIPYEVAVLISSRVPRVYV